MSDARRQLATDLGMLFARHMLKAIPAAEALLKDHKAVTLTATVRIGKDKGGTTRCRLAVTEPRSPRARPEVFTLALDEDQSDLFR